MIATPKLLAAWITYKAWAVVSAAADLVSSALDSTPTWARATAEEARAAALLDGHDPR